MDSSTGRPPSDSDVPSSSACTLETANIGGEDTRLANSDIITEHIQTLRRRAFEEKDQNQDLIPLGTPVDTLPNELLSYIFALGSEAEEDGDEDDEDEGVDVDVQRPRRLPFKVLVSHICRRWRTVVIETSTLWTHLDFTEGPPFHKSRTWLERSKGCVLDIELDCTVDELADSADESDDGDLPDASSSNDDDNADSSKDERVVASPPPEDRDAQQSGDLAPAKTKARRFPGRVSPVSLPIVRDLILPHAWRWRVFELMVNDYQIMYGILSTLSTIPEAAQLQGLRLYHYDDNDDYDHFTPPHLKQPLAPFCGRAPHLVQLALWGVHVDWAACGDFLLRGLEELELAYHAKDVRPPYDTFARILRRSPDLHILTLCASGPAGDPEDWPTDTIELPSVKHLVLAFVEPSYASALMKRLVFPNLSTLALDFDAGDYSSFLAQLASTRPAPAAPRAPLAAPAPAAHHHHYSLCHNLIDLKISGMHCTPSALATFYGALVNLASLNINCYHLPRHFFEYIFPDARKEGCYLPMLKTLSTSGIGGDEMRDLLRQRWEVPIKHLLMDSAADVDDKDEAWFRRKVETFDFFDGSDDEDEDDDEDDDDPMITELDAEQEVESAAFAAESNGMTGEWVDE